MGGVLVEAERWVSGVVLGAGGDGTFVIVRLDTPLGGGEERAYRALNGATSEEARAVIEKH